MPTLTQESQNQSITLYYKAGSSDKVYQARIEPSGDGFIVTFAYGRRGSTMNTGTKTPRPVGYPAALKIFEKLVTEKTAKGYTPGEEGTPYQQTDKAERATGIVPQLLNPVDEEEALELIADAAWWAQEKFDGRRVLIRRTADQVEGINRLGLIIALPEPIVRCAASLGSQQWLIDGEAVGDVLHVFDVLESACTDLRREPYSKRLKHLKAIVGMDETAAIRCVETATTMGQKKMMLARLKQQNREGLVFKRHAAPYTPGRPASRGDQRKLKFTATASCIIAAVSQSRRSVSLDLLDGDKRVSVGNVTIPPNHAIPKAGLIAEIRYLYAHVGGSLYQPVYLGLRDDLSSRDCTVGQLKFKPAGEDENGDSEEGSV